MHLLGKLARSYITSLTFIFNANPYIYIFYGSRAFRGCLQNTKDQLQYLSYSGSPRLSDKRPSRSPGPFSPLDSRRIANVVIAKNLNETHQQVQIQALEVFQSLDSSFTSWNGSLDVDILVAHSRQAHIFTNSSSCRTKAIFVYYSHFIWI